MPREPAPSRRVALAFLLAPVPSILIYAIREVGIGERLPGSAGLVALLGAYPLVLFVGVPLYLALHRTMRPELVWVCVLAGAIAALPWLLLALASGSGSSQIGSVVVMENGRLTWLGFWLRARLLGEIFALGALAGAVFWMLASRPVRQPAQG